MSSEASVAGIGDSQREGSVGPTASLGPDLGTWGPRVIEQFEELGWVSGLLRTLGERIARSDVAEAQAFGASLVRNSETLTRLREGAVAYANRKMKEGATLEGDERGWLLVVESLERCGNAMIGAAQSYTSSARKLPPLGDGLRTAMGEAMIISKLVEERGGQMRRLGERLRAEGATAGRGPTPGERGRAP